MMALPYTETEVVENKRPHVIYVMDKDRPLLEAIERVVAPMEVDFRPFNNPIQLIRAVADDDVGCVIADYEMSRMLATFQEQLVNSHSCLALIFVANSIDVPSVVEVMKRGATSVLLKPIHADVLAADIRRGVECSERAIAKRDRVRRAQSLLAKLSAEELAVLDFAIDGIPNREIAIRLEISPRTVDRRRQSALNKLEAESITEFAVLKTLVGGSRDT